MCGAAGAPSIGAGLACGAPVVRRFPWSTSPISSSCCCASAATATCSGRGTATDADPDAFDCSELVEWACARLGVAPTVPDGTWYQIRHCRDRGTETTVDDAVATQGALLFRFSSDPFTGGRPSSAHVAVSLGNGSTIEARGSAWGVGSWEAEGRGWAHAGLVPGVRYDAPPTAPQPGGRPATEPPWPGRYLTQPPVMSGTDVETWQEGMAARGHTIDVDAPTARPRRRPAASCRPTRAWRWTASWDRRRGRPPSPDRPLLSRLVTGAGRNHRHPAPGSRAGRDLRRAC